MGVARALIVKKYALSNWEQNMWNLFGENLEQIKPSLVGAMNDFTDLFEKTSEWFDQKMKDLNKLGEGLLPRVSKNQTLEHPKEIDIKPTH